MDKKLKIVLVVFAGVSILLLGLSLYSVLSTQSFMDTAEKTTGKVVDFIESSDDEGDIVYAPIVVYKTLTGKQIIYASSNYSYPAAYKKNELIDVYYDPQKPNRAELSGVFSLNGAAIISGILGLVCGILTLFFYVSIRKEAKQKS